MPRALITGASSGIGEQFAYLLGREGYELTLIARREERLRAVAKESERCGAAGTTVITADLADRENTRRVYRGVSQHGPLDLLINNAGFGSRGRFIGLALERELKQIDLNIAASLMLTRLFLPEMVTAGRGIIINVASTAGFQPVPFMATYAATKAFLLSLSMALAEELAGTGVHVMALCPGLTRTEFQAVAGNDRTWVPNFFYMDAKIVAEQGLSAARRGRTLYVNGRLNALGTHLARLAPLTLVPRVARVIFRESD